MKPTSRVSLTAVRKWMMDNALTGENAHAMFESTITITSATTIPLRTSVKTKLRVYDVSFDIRQFFRPQNEEQSFIRAAMMQLNLSARAYHCTRSVKLARMIADLVGSEEIQSTYLAEASK
ncbi:MAG TPA: hypothetical protein VMN99_11345 [Anaerolineales bacterium]|nr:hypothetical protein [Anaerolineales bacterium]